MVAADNRTSQWSGEVGGGTALALKQVGTRARIGTAAAISDEPQLCPEAAQLQSPGDPSF